MSRKYLILYSPAATLSGPMTGQRWRGSPRAGATAATAPAAVPRVETDLLTPRAAHELVRDRKVAAVAPVMPMTLVRPLKTQSASAGEAETPQWGLQAVGALSSPFDGAGIVVALLDTGIDPTHQAFEGVELERRNFTHASPDDADGHGTHCAGTVFGRPVGGRRIGVAPGVTKAMIGKVLGPGGGGSDQIAQAIQWALNGGAHVVSMSLGFDFPGYVKQLVDEGTPVQLATSLALEGYRASILLFERLASFASARGLTEQPSLLFAAAGNESQRGQNPEFVIAVSPPAVSEGFISVAALMRTAGGLAAAPFSNTGARICAPGVDIVSARAGGGLVAMDGTSMAAPHVAGVAALWAQKLQATGDLRVQSWRDRLMGSATQTGLAAGFNHYDIGTGLVRAPQV